MKTKMMKKSLTFLYIFLFVITNVLCSYASDQSFTQADRDRLIRMEVILEQHDKRFESIDKRFGSIETHIAELRADMNQQNQEIRADLRNIILLFGGLVTSIIGFAIWDRRTMLRPLNLKRDSKN